MTALAVVVVDGYASRIWVERGHLAILDGIGRAPRRRDLSRATSRVRRLVVLGHNGTISLEAMRWLHDIGAGYLQIDRDGAVLAAFGARGTDRPSLRRAQALALGQPIGAAIGQRLLTEKLHAQASALDPLGRVIDVDPTVARVIANLAEALETTDDPPGLRLIEARAAAAYWGAWSPLPVRFAHRDKAKVPEHWLTFGSRTSQLTGGSRLATNPANAMLNYLYALLEAEATIAARVAGLDPGLGVIHADQVSRDSLSMDLMEPIRPLVDRFVIDLVTSRAFAARDFFETREGVCRIMPGIAKELAQTAQDWYRAVGRVAEDVARMLDAGRSIGRPIPTPISERQRSVGRGKSVSKVEPSRPRVTRTCAMCGGSVSDQDRRTCGPECQAAERRARDIGGFVVSGVARLRELAAEGRDPRRSPEALGKLRRSQAQRRLEEVAWDLANRRPDDLEYRERLLPKVRLMTIGEIVGATGLSVSYSARIRRGLVIPHPRWWDALERTGTSSRP